MADTNTTEPEVLTVPVPLAAGHEGTLELVHNRHWDAVSLCGDQPLYAEDGGHSAVELFLDVDGLTKLIAAARLARMRLEARDV